MRAMTGMLPRLHAKAGGCARDDGTYRTIVPSYAVAYLARAVTPGAYILPAAQVEDMYAPTVPRARASAKL